MFTIIPSLSLRPRTLLIGVLLLAQLPASGVAQTTTARTILDGYVKEALQSNLAIAQRFSAERRAAAGVHEANGRFLPSIGVNARYSDLSGAVNIGDFINPAYAALNQLVGQERFPTNVNATLPFRQESKLELVQPLFNDALFGARAAARAQREMAGTNRRGAMRRLAADVQLAWLGYASATSVLATLEAMVPVLDENLRVSDKLVYAGQATPDIVLRARAERSDLDQQLADARQQRNAARRSFNMLRNQDGDAAIALADDSSLVIIDTLPRVALEASARAHREELQQADGAMELARAQSRIVASSYLPSLALSASYGVQGDRYRFDAKNDVAIASLVFSWNVFNGGQDAARREQASYLRDEAADQRREAERAVMLDVANAQDALVTARSGLQAATDRLESAHRAFTLVERRFGEGLATQIEFLSARSAYTAAALNQVITRFTFFARAVNLERAAALRALPQ